MVREKVKRLWGYYNIAHLERRKFFNSRWRLVVVLAAAIAMLFVNNYLDSKYYYVIDAAGSSINILADKLFYWFIVGVFFGILGMGLIYEGEYLINLNKLAKEAEKDAAAAVNALVAFGRRKKSVKKRGGRK